MARATTGLAYVTLGLVVLGGMVFTVFVTVPTWSSWGATSEVLQRKQAAREERERFLKNIDARIRELKTYETDARLLAVAFPETEASADLTAVLAALAARNSLAIKFLSGPVPRRDVPVPPRGEATAPAASTTATAAAVLREGGETTPGTVTPPTRQSAREVRVQLRGSYAGISAFIRDLEKSVRFFDVPNLELKGGSEDGTIEATVTVLTYLVEVPSAAGRSSTGSGTSGTPGPSPSPSS